MKDLRDPVILGEALLELAEDEGDVGLSVVQDRYPNYLGSCPNVVDVGPLERYGDPVAQHEAKIEAGLAVRLP